MIESHKLTNTLNTKDLLTFFAITLFYFFESAQMSYFNVLAPSFLSHGIYQHGEIASLSAAYYYGDMVGLLPVGFALDRFSLRKILLYAILGSIVGAFLLLINQNFYLQWFARFLCGLFGGTFSFVGGIRVLASLFLNRFTLFIGLFLSAGMLGGLLCQYPLLVMVNHYGPDGAMFVIALFGLLVIAINYFFLHPVSANTQNNVQNHYTGNTWQMCLEILKNYRNWLDCFMVVLLDTPVSIIGTLWGIMILMNMYHFSDGMSAWIVMALFAGLIIGSPLWGILADRYQYPAWIIVLGSAASFLTILMMLMLQHHNVMLIAILFFGLGVFSSCQTLGFTWLTKNMRPELIGRNSAFNSMIFMGSNGIFKQIGAVLLVATPLLKNAASASNLLIFMAAAMSLVTLYACIRNNLFNCFAKMNERKIILN